MTRDITAAIKTASQDRKMSPFLFGEFQIDSGTIFVSTLDHDISWNGDTWTGVGQIGAVSAVEESMALQATGLRMAITGIPSSYVTMVLSEDYQGRPAIVRLGFMDIDLGTIIVDPVIIFQGFIDQMKLTDGDTATIQITCENELIAWQRPNVARYTNADQQALYPGDLGLEFVSQAVEKEIVWGSGPAPVTMYNAYGRGAWVQNYDPFGQPILPDWWNDLPPPPGDPGGGVGGDAGGGAF